MAHAGSAVATRTELESKTELDAVNAAAYRLGVRPRQTISRACASVEHLIIHALPRARVISALTHIAEVALRFGAPVSFQAPDTVWIDVSGSTHLYESERELVLELSAQIRALGYSPRVVIADGPWLAQSFARHGQLEPPGILLVDSRHTVHAVNQLPILALPIQREAASWFSRLGLLTLQDLRTLPPSALASRLEERTLNVPLTTILDLIQGRDASVLVPHHPEEMPREELFWEDPLESVEPLLFVLKGLSGRLSARLEGRGQAAQELLLTLHYDRAIAALSCGDTPRPDLSCEDTPRPGLASPTNSSGPETQSFEKKSLAFKLASPLFHAEDLERVMRLRLQRQSLIAPTLGLSLQATSVTEARFCQLGLSDRSDTWAASISTDPRALAVLVAELSADIGSESVGVLALQDSHLPEKTSALLPFCSAVHSTEERGTADHSESGWRAPSSWSDESAWFELPRIPTRLFDPPIEVHAPIRKGELWVIRERAFVVSKIQFEQRLEGIEWWARNRVFRDYFRVWLADAGTQQGGGGLEALVYRDRDPNAAARHMLDTSARFERCKSYLHALYD